MSGTPAQHLEMFTSVTGASEADAKKYLEAAGGDAQQAILMFLEAAEGGEPAAPAAAAAPARAAPAGADIDSIVGLAKDGQDNAAKGSGKGSGKKGDGKGDDLESRQIGIIFFAEGFMVDEEMAENEEEEKEEEAAVEAPKPPTRGIRMMSLDDLNKGTDGGRPKLPKKIPKLGPLRGYDTAENKAFLDDIKAGKVPKELQKKDAKGRPMYTTIAVSDERPRTYAELEKALEQLKKMKEEHEAEDKKNAPAPSTMFTGAGNTCGSSAAASTPAAAGSGACDPALLALVRAAAAPTVDESKPATTLQLRLSTGARVKARLNLDHTVADLWRVVAREMGAEAFATASGQELCAGFPPKPLKDNSATLKAADLANASVTHRSR